MTTKTAPGERMRASGNLYPAAYWRLWCDLIAHQYVLEQVKIVAEDLSARAE